MFFCAFFSLLIVGAIGHSGCANIIPPTGGPKDTIPPILVSAVPHDTTRNFKGNKIVFTFDEYIDGKDIRANLVVSPVPKIEPITDAKLRTITIKLKDTLEQNTTYSLNFYRGVKDVNEGNVLKNFTYVFSTGNHIDSGRLEGHVILAQTGKVDTTIVVMLHRKFDDSAVVKERPRYITRVDSNGRFVFRFIEPGRYALFAMKDEGGSHKYLSKSQLFAFADSPVDIRANTGALQTLYAYSEVADTKPAAKSGSSTTTPAPKPAKSAKDKQKDRILQVQTNTANGVFDLLDTFRLSFATGLKVYDSTLVRFTDENFKDINTKLYRFSRDTTNKTIFLYYVWPLDTKFNLVLAKGFAQDSAGRKLLKDDTIAIHTKKDIDYGEVRIRVFNLDLSRHPVLLFLQSDAVKYAFPFGNRKEIRQLLFKPGEYDLRILYDLNDNKRWDPGSYFGKQRRQPEKVTPIRQKFTVKANWDNDKDITLSP